MTQQEIKRRANERTTYCNNCDEMTYSISTQYFINEIAQHRDLKLFQSQSSKLTNYYKILMPLSWVLAGVFLLFTILNIVIVIVPEGYVERIITGFTGCGVLIVAGFILKFLKIKKEEKNQIIKQQIQEKVRDLEGYMKQLREDKFQYVCSKCFNGVILHKRAPTKQEQIEEAAKYSIVFCEKCGFENKIESKFCSDCGYSLESIRTFVKTRSRHIPSKVRYAVYLRDEGRCVECGSREDIQFDHIIPFSKGGASTVENLQILCQRCNLAKSDKIM